MGKEQVGSFHHVGKPQLSLGIKAELTPVALVNSSRASATGHEEIGGNLRVEVIAVAELKSGFNDRAVRKPLVGLIDQDTVTLEINTLRQTRGKEPGLHLHDKN